MARVEPSYLFNPVLLKSQASNCVQVIVNGLVYKNQSIATYYDEIEDVKSYVQDAFAQLQKNYDLVVSEGAGSPVELICWIKIYQILLLQIRSTPKLFW